MVTSLSLVALQSRIVAMCSSFQSQLEMTLCFSILLSDVECVSVSASEWLCVCAIYFCLFTGFAPKTLLSAVGVNSVSLQHSALEFSDFSHLIHEDFMNEILAWGLERYLAQKFKVPVLLSKMQASFEDWQGLLMIPVTLVPWDLIFCSILLVTCPRML